MRRHTFRTHPGPTTLLPVDDELFWPHAVQGPLTPLAHDVLRSVERNRGPAAAIVKEAAWRRLPGRAISVRADIDQGEQDCRDRADDLRERGRLA
jgi:hypothetical protein